MVRMISKSVPQLKKGDIVAFYGAKFRILADAALVSHPGGDVYGAVGACMERNMFPPAYLDYDTPGMATFYFQGNELAKHAVYADGITK